MLRNSINLASLIWRNIMVLNKSAVKKLFNEENIQVNVLALHYIDEWALGAIKEMVENARAKGIRRVKPNTIDEVCPVLVWEPPGLIDKARDTIDIVEVISRYVDLTKRGRNFFGLCPFHDEKTPSFSVAPDKGIYHCFGCGNGGSVINFLMEIQNMNSLEVVAQLKEQLSD